MLRSRWQLTLALVLGAGVSGIVLLGRWGEWLGQWQPTVDWWAASAFVVMPVAALSGSLRGYQSRRNGRAILAATASRPALVTAMRDIAAGVVPALVGYLGVLVAALIISAAAKPFGSPPFLECVAFMAAVTAAGVLGYAAAFVYPHPAVPPVLCVGALVLPAGLSNSQAWTNLVPPLASIGPFYYVPAVFTLLQLAFFLALASLGWFVASKARVLTVTAVVAVVLLELALAPIPQRVTVRANHAASSPVCRTHGGVGLCVARVQSNQLDRLSVLVGPLDGLLNARFPQGVTLAASGVDANQLDRGRGGLIVVGLRWGHNAQAAHFARAETLADLAPAALGVPLSCPPFIERQGGALGVPLAGELMAWFAATYHVDVRQLGYWLPTGSAAVSTGLAKRLAQRPQADVETWIASAHVQGALAACAATSKVAAP